VWIMSKQPIPEGLRRAIDQHHIAVNHFVNGDCRLWKELCSKEDDVTIIGGWGGYERGWEEVGARYDWAAAQFVSSGSRVEIENVSIVAGSDLAFTVDIERSDVRLQVVDRVVPMALRVTTVYRREGEEWKMTHRHADSLVANPRDDEAD
jgi:SnoaL-like domain